MERGRGRDEYYRLESIDRGSIKLKIRFLLDENEIVRLFPLALAEGKNVGLDTSKLNPDKLWNTLRSCMEHATIIVSEDEFSITGMMALCLVESYWSDDYTLTNLIYWVQPEYRKSTAGLSLLRAAREYAIERGLEFNLHVESFEDLDRKDKFFQRYGFARCGGNY